MGKCITAEVSNAVQIIRLWMHTYLHNNPTTLVRLVLQCYYHHFQPDHFKW